MSAFTTPSRMTSTAAAAAGIGHSGSRGGSSGRRVVRSALEILMDTASPELAGKCDAGIVGSVRRPAAAPTSSFSVTYTATSADRPAPSQTQSTLRGGRGNVPLALDSPGAVSIVKPHSRAEPSALDFMTPNGKSAGRVSSHLRQSSDSPPPHRSRGRLCASAPGATTCPSVEHSLHQQRDRKDVHRNKRNADSRKVDGRIEDVDFKASSSSPAIPNLVSPSRSLSADVEAAQQALLPVAETSSVRHFSHTRASSPLEPATRSVHQASNAAARGRGLEGLETREDNTEGEATAVVTRADMEAVVDAALRRYEQERDAEEEAVLQQVSREVEEQASSHAELMEAYNAVCADRAALEEKFTKAAEDCEELRQALQKARHMDEVQRSTIKRLEVDLCHARDALKEQQRTVLKSDAVEWEAQRTRYEKRLKTLEAQLDQADQDLREKEACLTQQKKELAALREGASKKCVEAEVDYAEIHLRMGQLAQNMTSMESALRERDATIAEQAARLREVSEKQQSEARALTTEKEKTEAALTVARDALQRQTDEIRRRMHRLAHLEQQKRLLKDEARAAWDTVRAASVDQGRVLQSLQDLLMMTKGHLSPKANGRTRLRSPSPTLSLRDHHRSLPCRRGDDVNSTLIYEDDHEHELDGPQGCLAVSESSSRSSSATRTLEMLSSDDGYDVSHGRLFPRTTTAANAKHRSVSSPTPRNHRALGPSPSPEPVTGRRRARTSSPRQPVRLAVREPPAKSLTDYPSTSSASHELRQQGSRAIVMVRDLHRCVLSLLSRRQKLSSSREVDAAGSGWSPGVPGATVAKLEQACRYLKLELDRVRAELREAQAECQWRTLSMDKWENDLQVTRREVLAAEKRRLECEAQAETAMLLREELEAQLRELTASSAAATAAQKNAEGALAEAKSAAERSAARADEAARLREAAESSFTREQAKCAEQAGDLRGLTDQLKELEEKYTSAIVQLETHHAREAAQHQQQQQEGHEQLLQLTELRNVVETMKAAHESAAEMWRTEQASLEALVSSLEAKHRALTEMMVDAKHRCATLEEQLILHVQVEKTTLKTIGDIARAPPLPESFDVAGNDEGFGVVHTGGGVSPTAKQLFAHGEKAPVVEEIVVERAEATPSRGDVCKKVVNASSHSRTHTRRTTALSSVSARLATAGVAPSSPTTSAATSLALPASSPSRDGASQRAQCLTTPSCLSYLRQHIVSAVQHLALEVARLQQCSDVQFVKVPVITQPQTGTSRLRGVASSALYLGGETAPDNVYNRIPAESSSLARVSSGEKRRSSVVAVFPSPTSGAVSALRRHRENEQQNEQKPASSNCCPSTASVAQTQTPAERSRLSPLGVQTRSGSSSTPLRRLQPAPAGDLSGSCSPPVPAVTATTCEHMYNVSQWTGFSLQRSPSLSASPPASLPTAPACVKVWGEEQRSISTGYGLSGHSLSTRRGSVDGSCSPARPPSLRAFSVPR